MNKKYSVCCPDMLRQKCIKMNYFTEGSNRQYDKLCYANEQGCPITEIATIIWICSDTENICRRDILFELEQLHKDYIELIGET